MDLSYWGSSHYVNGKLHNMNGPAFIYNTGHFYWYYNDKLITKCCIIGYAPETNHKILGWSKNNDKFYFKECYLDLISECQDEFDRIIKLKCFW